MRIAVGGIGHESNTFNPARTSIDSFHLRRGEDILREEPASTLRSLGIEVIPTVLNRAFASGVVDTSAYLAMKAELLQSVVNSGDLDAVCLMLHGAMVVKGIGCAEADLLKSLRQIIGDEVIVAASLDLHGNIPVELADYVNILTAYRTAPHTDRVETEIKAAMLLMNAVTRGWTPQSLIVRPPILLPGEYVVTTLEPTASLYQMLGTIDNHEGIMDSSLLVGMAWADVAHAGAAAIAVAIREADEDAAREGARKVAKAYWEARNELRLEVEAYSAEEAVKQAKLSEKQPFFISDSGDNVTAGAAGDLPILVEQLIVNRVDNAVVAGIQDKEAVEACRRADVGETLRLEIGGKLDQVNGYPLDVRGRIVNCTEKGLVFRSNGVDVVLTENLQGFTSPEEFMAFGIDPSTRSVIVVKLGYLFPALRKIAAKAVMALTPGFTDLSTERLNYQNIPQPMFPIDKECSWVPK
jgi:microcystin degradation protein MlrC